MVSTETDISIKDKKWKPEPRDGSIPGSYIGYDMFDISPVEPTPEQKFNLEDVEKCH